MPASQTLADLSNSKKVDEAANLIGIREPCFKWIAEVAATVELPMNWQSFVDETGSTAYYQPKLKLLQTTHPGMDKFVAMYQKQKAFYDRMSEKMPGFQGLHEKLEASMALLLNECMNRCNKELPPATPELIEKFALLFNVDTTKEFVTVREIKQQVDLFAEKHYDAFKQVGSLADPRHFIQQIRRHQVLEDVTTKADAIVMCTEYDQSPAVVKCEQCKDFFSIKGFKETHATGKRKSHATMKVVQEVCVAYTNRPATCIVNDVYYCDQAYAEKVAKDVDFRLQHKKLLSGLRCTEFENMEAEVVCEQCCDLFSWQGYLKLHRRGNRRHHVPLIITDNGQLKRHGAILPLDESYKMTDTARLAGLAGPWQKFSADDQMDYWFNFCTKETTFKSPYMTTSTNVDHRIE